MATYLIQKPGESTWYVRMAVPADARHAFGGRSKLIKTTGTSNKAEAMDRRLPILARWKADIAVAKEQKLLTRDQWRTEVAAWSGELDSSTHADLISASRGTLISEELEPEEREVRKQMVLNELSLAIKDPETLQGMFNLLEKGAESDSVLQKVQSRAEFLRAFAANLAKSSYRLTPTEASEAHAILQNPSVYKPVSPITDRRLELFRAYRVASLVALKTIDQQESKLKNLSAYLKKDGESLNHETVALWLESKALSSKTKAQYLLAGSTFWQWALKNDVRWRGDFKGTENPFAGQALPKLRPDERARSKRKAYTVDGLASIYAAARASDKSALCDLIALGYYTGARIEELAKLRIESIITIEGVRTIDVDAAKSYAGVRQIPVHPQLETLIDRLIGESTDGFLLKSSGGNKYGIRSDSLSKAFGRLKTSLGFDKLHVFHSVRKTTITQLLRQSIPGNVVANIVGHETGLITFDVYDEGASPQQKLEALRKLPLMKV